jgi:hypothetical protein
MRRRHGLLRVAPWCVAILGLAGVFFMAVHEVLGEEEGFQDGLGEVAPEDLSLEEVDQQLNNPLTSLWSLTFQENFSLKRGDAVEGTETANTFFFQPALPVPLGNDKVLIARPVFPLVTAPDLLGGGHETGLGDIQLFTMLGPDRTDGWVWGAGATFKFPTATDDLLGAEKWQAGPAAMAFYLGEKWTVGMLAQHWNSFAGDDSRPATSQTDIQYVARMKLPGAMSIGMGPTMTVDWKAESGNRVTLPIGLGLTKTVRFGKTPVKMRFEPQYSLIKPDDFGTTWNFRVQITPVIPSPYQRK